MQKTSTHVSSDRRTAVIAAVWGGVAGAVLGPVFTLICNRAADYVFPSVQRFTLVGASEALGSPSETPAIEKLRDNAPPFIYRLRFDHHEDSYWKWFQKIPQQWVYSLDIANLTRIDQNWVEVSLRCTTPDSIAAIAANGRSDLFLHPDNDNHPVDGTDFSSKRSIAFIRPLQSGKSKTYVVCIYSQNAPDPKDIELRVSSPDGEYTAVSNAAWDAVGWQH